MVANVAFQGSLQIVISAFYILLYAMAKVLMRVLCSSELVKDPAVDRYDDLDLGDLGEDAAHSPTMRPAAAKGRWDRMRTARTAIKQKMQAISSRILLNPGAAESVASVESLENAGSITDMFSDMDESDDIDSATRRKRDSKMKRVPIGTIHSKPIYAAGALKDSAQETSTDMEAAGAKHDKQQKPPTQPLPVAATAMQNDGFGGPAFSRPELPFAEPAIQEVAGQFATMPTHDKINAFAEMYGLGFSMFVVFYCIDCASMQPAFCMLVGITVLSFRDCVRITDPLLVSHEAVETNLVKATTIIAFMLALAAQICVAVGIGRVPSYHSPLRDGSILKVPAPATLLDTLLAIVFPICAPLLLHFVSKRQNVPRLQSMVRNALPTTMLIALWFLTSLGTMKDELRATLGVSSVNQTLDELFKGDRVQAPVAIFAPFFKIPAVLAVVSCCISGKSVDILTSLSLIFFTKQKGLVRERAMIDMLVVAVVFSAWAWALASLRYWTPLMRWIATRFN